MMTLVTGGSGSGKSEYAERLAAAGGTPRIYVATMIPWDDEGRRRIEKHRAMRAGKGFETVECYTGLERLAGELARRLEVESIQVRPDGSFEFWFHDGDFVWEHAVRVSGTLEQGPTDVGLDS